MSTMRLTTLIAAMTITAATTLAYILEGVARADLVPEPVAVLMSVGIIVLWLGYFCAHVRDSLITAIHTAIDDAADRAATDARLDLMRRTNPNGSTPAPGHPNGHGGTRPTLVT